jgi:hypothetical protein
MHNARCLKHVSKCFRSMAASIVRENLNLAMTLCEQQCNVDMNSSDDASQNRNGLRRKRYKDFLSGTDSSTDG